MNSSTETVEIDVKHASQRQIIRDGEAIKINIKCEPTVNDGREIVLNEKRVPIEDESLRNGAELEPIKSFKNEGAEQKVCNEYFQNDMFQNGNMHKKNVKSPDLKTVKLCQFYKRYGKCKFEDKCYYSHHNRTDDTPIKSEKNFEKEYPDNCNDSESNEINEKNVNDTSIPSVEKHIPFQENILNPNGDNSYLNINSCNAIPCKFFVTQMGCKFGDDCSFTHYRSVGDAGEEELHDVSDDFNMSIREPESADDIGNIQTKDGTKLHHQKDIQQCSETDQNKKTRSSKKRCTWFLRNGFCKKGEQCDFAHILKGEASSQVDDSSFKKLTLSSKDDIDNAVKEPHILPDLKEPSNVDSSNSRKPRICHFFFKRSGCRLKDSCPFLHERLENIKLNKSNVNATKENTLDEKQGDQADIESNKERIKCRYQSTANGCKLGSKCSFQHDEPQTVECSVDVEIEQVVQTKSDEFENHSMNDVIKTANQSNQICTFYLSPRGCFRGKKCGYLHPVDGEGMENCEDYLYLQEREYRQLEKRFSAGNKFKLVQTEPSTIYLIIFEPTDPDWGIVVKEFLLQVEFPSDYPKKLFHIALQDNEMYPEGFTRFMNEGIQIWFETRQLERDENDLAFRPFLKWFDRNAESLVLDAGRKVKQLRDAEECGITLIPHDDILQSNPTDSLESQTSLPCDEEQSFDLVNSNGNESNSADVNAMMTQDDDNDVGASGQNAKLSSKVKVGTEVKFSRLEMNENVASMILKNILLIVQCIRCKGRTEFNLQSKKKASMSCKKCRVNHTAAFHPEIIHQYSHIAGYLHLEGCRAFDMVLIDSTVILNCLNCSKDNTKKGIAYGKKGDYWCEFCHTKMEMQIVSTKFTQLQKNGEKLQEVKPVGGKKPVKYPGIKEGSPLPSNGTCKHYKKSYRWLRFPCCGKIYPCDICHEESEQNDHEMKFATRMICGFCSKEQPFAKDKPCVSCKQNVTKSHSAHWEGGKGCRNRTNMDRGENRKTAGLGKTISRKKANDT